MRFSRLQIIVMSLVLVCMIGIGVAVFLSHQHPKNLPEQVNATTSYNGTDALLTTGLRASSLNTLEFGVYKFMSAQRIPIGQSITIANVEHTHEAQLDLYTFTTTISGVTYQSQFSVGPTLISRLTLTNNSSQVFDSGNLVTNE